MNNLTPVSITDLSIEDMEDQGFDASGVNQKDLNYIAKKMADNYIENYFWEDLDFHCNQMGLKQLNS